MSAAGQPHSSEATGTCAATAAAQGAARWVGRPVREAEGRTFHVAFEAAGQQFNLGDSMYLRPAQPGLPAFVAKLESLHQQQGDGSKWAEARWYYRRGGQRKMGPGTPTELEVGHEVSVEANELFWSDDFATHPLDAGKASAQAAWPAAAGRGQRVWRAAACRGVPPRLRRARRPRPRQQVNAARAAVWRPAAAVCGKCEVRTPAQADRRPGSSASRPAGPDTFVCSRKYIQEEGRIVPLDGGTSAVNLTAALQEKPFAVVRLGGIPHVEGKVVQRGPSAADRAAAQPRPKRVRAAPAADKGGTPVPSSGQPQQQQAEEQLPSKRRRQGREAYSPDPFGPSTAAAAAAAGAAAAAARPIHREEDGSSDDLPSIRTTASQQSGGTAGGGSRRAQPKAKKETTGSRWAKDRYDAAQQSLAAIMRRMGATAAARAIVRPALREEARKTIGDTGLLDHLLKHMADHVVSPAGERLRRRHDAEGHMIYWLQLPADAEQEEEALREEMESLSSEMRVVREARRVLSAVRGEAAQAIQAVRWVAASRSTPSRWCRR
ncbi:hypothetical protein CHLNCDRAFT_51293 [Chlorella variabilis]|uniref:BAH domain-containing protein n=1 Tax=Chlorella variabilis TaxID=554065 RepID=E1ZA70_CHLVA|nr:hypothetical protein CHLNCDRAFT_51293 [Chlorella variabilis]EFN57214.1 hypothetical protein CHLNCDRAFT_51293 [Chlorella variabilis]|eukprot:XP_005849316.1 hypothetical protein CHLNCDRAFT_51293 [Chlorella variabilis]